MRNIVFEKNYKHFEEFYQDTQETINIEIIEALKTFDKKNNPIVNVKAEIDGVKFGHDFILTIPKGIEMIEKSILPYFESIQNYEYCEEIKTLHNKLVNQL